MVKKFWASAAAVLAAAALVLTGCGGAKPSAEELARKAVDDGLSQVKNMDDEVVDEISADALESFSALGIDPKEYFKSFMAGFDYSIDKIEVDEDAGTGTAMVTVSCKSLNSIVQNLTEDLIEKAQQEDPESLTEERLTQLAGEILKEKTDSAPTREVQIELPLVRDDAGSWDVGEDGVEEIFTKIFTD